MSQRMDSLLRIFIKLFLGFPGPLQTRYAPSFLCLLKAKRLWSLLHIAQPCVCMGGGGACSAETEDLLKETVTRGIRFLVFFINQLPLGHWLSP
jgi:hypothetical protein